VSDPERRTDDERPAGGRAEQRFDAELRAVARALVQEELPRGIMDRSLAPERSPRDRTRSLLPALAGSLILVGLLLLASVVVLAPTTVPSPSPSPTPAATRAQLFRDTAVVRGELLRGGYACNDGRIFPSPDAAADAVVRESLVCDAPDSVLPVTLSVTLGETIRSEVVDVVVRASIVGDETMAAREAVAARTAELARVVLYEAVQGSAAAAWLSSNVPLLEPGKQRGQVLGSLLLQVQVESSSSYVVSMSLAIGN